MPKGGSPNRISTDDYMSPVLDLEMSNMKKEIEILQRDLMKAKQTIASYQEREKKLKDR